MNIHDLLAILNEIAPPEMAEDYDNVGLLAGREDEPVRNVLVALDPTVAVLDEAARLGANAVVVHHPILFLPLKTLREDDAQGALHARIVRDRVSLIAVHTNFDNAPWGTSDVLSDALGIHSAVAAGHGLRVGDLSEPLAPPMALEIVQSVLGGSPKLYADSDRPISRVAVCAGAGGGYYRDAIDAGAELFVTGEIRYHDALTANSSGMAVIDAGHLETERIAIPALAGCLQDRFDALQYDARAYASEAKPYQSASPLPRGRRDR